MRYLTLTCASLALIAGTVSVALWRDQQADRELTEELRMKLAAAEQRVANTLTATPRPFAQATDAGESTVAQPAAVATPANRPIGTVRSLSKEQELLKNPEHRKARLAQLRLNLPQNYPGLLNELALSPAEADQLWGLLAEYQLEKSANGIPMVNGRMDPLAVQESGRALQEAQRNFNASLAALLGGSRYQQWQDYQETRSSRQLAVQLGRTLKSNGQPLNDAQTRNLTTALIAEQEQRQASGFGGLRISDAAPQTQARLQAESNRRVVEAAASNLSARQLEILRAALDQRITRTRDSSRVQPAGGTPLPR